METITNLTQNPYLANALQLFLNPTPYFLVLVLLFLFIFIYGMNVGRGRMILILLSLYVAALLTALFPYRSELIENVKIGEPYFIEIGLFLAAFFLVLFLLLLSPLRSMAVKSKGHLFHVFALSVLILGIFISHLTVSLPAEYSNKLNHPVFDYFRSETAQFWWTLLGVAALAVLRKRGE